MKFLRIPVLALATLTVSFAAEAQTLDEIVNNHITAIGGKEKINAMKSMYVESEMDIMGTAAPSVTTVLFGKGSLGEVNYNGQKIINCVTADKGGWAINPLAGQVTAEAMPEEQVNAGKAQLSAGGSLYNYAAAGNKVELAGQEDVKGVKAWKLVVTTKEGAHFVHYIDPATWQIVRTVAKVNMGGQEVEQGINFSDYRKTDFGFVTPWSYAIEFPNGMTLTVSVKKVEINKEVDPKIFEKP
jgi:outer membrane lipoprotein-sorting protein